MENFNIEIFYNELERLCIMSMNINEMNLNFWPENWVIFPL